MRVDSVSPALDLPVIPRRDSDPAGNRELIKAIAAINRSGLFGQERDLAFMLDRESHRPALKIVDRMTRDVISEIPGEQALRLAEHLRLVADGGGCVG